MTALLYTLAAAIVATFIAFMRGRVSGAKLERQKNDAAEKRARDAHDEVQNDIGTVPPKEAREELGTWDR